MTRSDIRELKRVIGIKERNLKRFSEWLNRIRNLPESKGKRFSAFEKKLSNDMQAIQELKHKLAKGV